MTVIANSREVTNGCGGRGVSSQSGCDVEVLGITSPRKMWFARYWGDTGLIDTRIAHFTANLDGYCTATTGRQYPSGVAYTLRIVHFIGIRSSPEDSRTAHPSSNRCRRIRSVDSS